MHTSDKPTRLSNDSFQARHAFLIGINAYEKVASLQTPQHDAEQLAAVLKEKYGYTIHLLLNPKGAELKSYVKNMAKIVAANDCAVFYFAGHGIASGKEDGLKGYIVPADADTKDDKTLIPMSWLHKHFSTLECLHFQLILDCCFAGAFRWAKKYRSVGFENETLYQQHYYYYLQHPSWQVLTSASHTQKALDHFGERDGAKNKHSPFARCLIDGLNGQADVNKDKIVTTAELYAYLQLHVPTITGAQTGLQNVGLFP